MQYHDREWGCPVDDDRTLFEKICLEGFQSGLSWLTILRKREGFRKAFKNFEFDKVAKFGPDDIERLVQNAAIVRHRKKIESTINNAQRARELVDEYGSLAAFFWQYEPEVRKPPRTLSDVAGKTPESTALSKDLKRRGWSFVGPTTCYAFMQAMGMVNDHLKDCSRRTEVERLRAEFQRP
ncbi:DNA-3-methyladenine glycosylase I [Rubinisphaera sp. ICM_H10]|nr:DNA-3-methyladenine glycosylase I [Rubinisphaera margarita]